MNHDAPVSLLREGVVLLGFGLGCVLLFRRLGLGATLGYLVAGVLVGPQVLGLAGDAQGKMGIAELGITLLLFLVGLELNPSRLWRMKREIFGLGLLQVAACGLVLAGVVWIGTRFSVGAALALGLPLALSSTAQVLPMLQSAGRFHTPFGERAFSILLFQDLSIVPLITIVAALSRQPAEAGARPGWQLALFTVVAVIALVAAGRFVMRPFFRLIGHLGEREMFVFAGLLTVAAAAAVMQAFGLSTALGAFVAGVMLADTPYRHEIEADVEPFRSILLGLFFLAVGMSLDLSVVAQRPFFVVGMAAALIATKVAVVFAIGLAVRMTWRAALALGLLLSQGGEFAFVLFAQGAAGAVIQPSAASLFGAVVTLSMATTPFLMAVTRRFRAEPKGGSQTRAGPVTDGANALIVGYGRFGQTVAQILHAEGVPLTLIDRDVEMIDIASEFGSKVYYGDGTRLDLLRQAGAGEAELILFCQDGPAMATDVLEEVARSFPGAAIFVRAFDRRAVVALRKAPIDYAVREVLESAVVMARRALARIAVDADAIDRAEATYRARDKERLRAQLKDGDLKAARHLVPAVRIGER